MGEMQRHVTKLLTFLVNNVVTSAQKSRGLLENRCMAEM